MGAGLLEQLARSSNAPELARASILAQAVQARLMTNQPDRAFDDATAALALAPDDADLLIDRARAAGDLGRLDAAVANLTQALSLDGQRADALVLRARAWRREERLDQAERDVDRALSLVPDDPEALLERGILRQRRGDEVGARSDWQRAQTLDPSSAAADLAEQHLARFPASFHRKEAAILVARSHRERNDCAGARAVLAPWLGGTTIDPAVAAAVGRCSITP